MSTRQPTKRALLLRQRAARVQERALPDLIGSAYGVVPIELSDLPSGDQQLADLRDRARASLLKQGVLTAEELDTLTADQALAAALQRVRDRAASLQDQAELQATQEKSNPSAFGKPPRTMRQG